MADETTNRYRKAEPMARLVVERAKDYPGLLAEVERYTEDDWTVIAVDAGVSDGTYRPSAETCAFAWFLVGEKIKNAADPFAGVM